MCYTALLLLEVYQHSRQIPVWARWQNAIWDATVRADGLQYDVLNVCSDCGIHQRAGELLASSISDWTGISMSAPLACCCSLLLPVAWFVSELRGRFI